MSRYTVEIARRAIKSIAGLLRHEQHRVRAAIDLLADEPRPPSCVALTGEQSAYRVRVGDYRILYEVVDERLVIHVVRVGHRRDVYRPR
ncbi:MAG: type II toxin-antitoxin system RelE/ParE family toxin [Acidimicrobiaceae bacterium]|nr:type II toxin-antitoxin system RelE/ParE family toxin [Acidimicrobiaceae bacterium]MYK75015.1 type II toxin-antitoxin system RelE/ParE family toxin [Acidimicrobiaceae bacterium]